MAVKKPLEVGIGIKATDRSGIDLVAELNRNVETAAAAVAEAQAQGGLPAIVGQEQLTQLEALRVHAEDVRGALAQVESQLKGMDEGSAAFAELTAKAKGFRDELAQVNQQIEGLPAKLRAAAKDSDLVGRADTGFSAVGGLAGAVGGAGAGEAFMAASDVLAVADAMKNLSGELVKAPGLIGQVATAGATMAVSFLGPAAAGLGAVLAVAAPVVLIIGGLVAVLAKLQGDADAAREEVKDYVAQLKEQQAVQREINDFVENGDIAGAKARLAELRKDQADANGLLTALYQQKADIDKAYADLGASLNVGDRNQLGARGQEIQAQIDDLYQNAFEPVTRHIQELEAAMADIERAAADQSAVRDQLRLLEQRAELEQQTADLIRSGTRDTVRDRQQAIQDEIAAIRSILPELETLAQTSDAAAQKLADAQAQQQRLNAEYDRLASVVLPAVDARQRESDALRLQVEGLLAAADVQRQMTALVESANSRQLELRQQALLTERRALTDLVEALQPLASTSEEARQQLEATWQEMDRLTYEMIAIDQAMPAAKMRERIQGLAELEQATVDADRTIGDIRADGLARLVDIEQRASDAQAAALKKRDDAINKVIADMNKRTAEVNREYMANERKAWEDFYRSERELAEQNRKDRLRLIEDINQSLLEAEENNDVNAFIQAKRSGEQQLRRMQEDADDATRQRTEQFLRERAEADAQHQQALDQIRTQAEEQRALAETNYRADLDTSEKRRQEETERLREDIAKRIAAEEDALAQRIFAIQENYNLEQSLIDDVFAQRKSRYKDDDKIINERLDTAIQRHAEDTKRKQDAEIAANKAITDSLTTTTQTASKQASTSITNDFAQAARQISGTVISMIGAISAAAAARASSFGTSSSSGSSGLGTGANGLQAIAFANQGIVDRPTLALIGEKLKPGEKEGVFKFRPSEGLPAGIGGQTINLNVGTISIGEGATITQTEVRDALASALTGVFRGIENARSPMGRVQS